MTLSSSQSLHSHSYLITMIITVTSLSFLPSSCDDDDDGYIITLSSLSFLPDGHDDDGWWEDHGSNFLFIDRCLTRPTAYSCFSEQTPPLSTHLSHSPACLTAVRTVPLQQIWYHPLLCCMHLSPRYSGHMTPLSTCLTQRCVCHTMTPKRRVVHRTQDVLCQVPLTSFTALQWSHHTCVNTPCSALCDHNTGKKDGALRAGCFVPDATDSSADSWITWPTWALLGSGTDVSESRMSWPCAMPQGTDIHSSNLESRVEQLLTAGKDCGTLITQNSVCKFCFFFTLIHLERDSGKDRDPRRWGKREIEYLLLQSYHHNASCIKMGSSKSHFDVSLIVRDKVRRYCPQTTTFEEKGELKQNQNEAPLLTSLMPYHLAKLAQCASPACNLLHLYCCLLLSGKQLFLGID